MEEQTFFSPPQIGSETFAPRCMHYSNHRVSPQKPVSFHYGSQTPFQAFSHENSGQSTGSPSDEFVLEPKHHTIRTESTTQTLTELSPNQRRKRRKQPMKLSEPSSVKLMEQTSQTPCFETGPSDDSNICWRPNKTKFSEFFTSENFGAEKLSTCPGADGARSVDLAECSRVNDLRNSDEIFEKHKAYSPIKKDSNPMSLNSNLNLSHNNTVIQNRREREPQKISTEKLLQLRSSRDLSLTNRTSLGCSQSNYYRSHNVRKTGNEINESSRSQPEKIHEFKKSTVGNTSDDVEDSSKAQGEASCPPASAGLPELTDDLVTAYLEQHPHLLQRWLPSSGAERHNVGAGTNTRSSSVSRKDSSQTVLSDSSLPLAAVNYCRESRSPSGSPMWLAPTTGSAAGGKTAVHLTEEKLFMELIRDISTELDIDKLCHKILVNVGHLTHADRASLFLAQGPRNSRHLVAKLFDVTVDSVLEDSLSNAQQKEILLPWGVGIVGYVASTKEVINITDAYKDPRFDSSVDRLTGYRTISVLCMPVCNYEGTVIGVAEIINKKNGTTEFNSHDVEVFKRYLTFCGIGIQNAQLFEISKQEYKRNQLLLQLARSIFEEQTSLERLVKKIMTESKDILKCEKCAVYLIDKTETDEGKVSTPSPSLPSDVLAEAADDADKSSLSLSSLPLPEHVLPDTVKVHARLQVAFETSTEMQDGHYCITRHTPSQLVASQLAKLAGYVADKERTLNISDVVSWLGAPLEDAGGPVYSVLTMPVYNAAKVILGVAQFINKEDGLHFSEDDIRTSEAFAIFSGLGIQNTQVYEKACRLTARQKVALECLSYHATAPQADTDQLKAATIPDAKYFHLYEYDFNEEFFTDDQTGMCVIRMFQELNLLNFFNIPYEVMCRYVLSVKKNYRPVKYHNWRHALTVCQTMFAMLKTGKLNNFMDELEMLGLLVACLSHDLDHRGTNNAFETKTDSPLAILYSTSTMEHHHFDQCVMILSQDSNNIFQTLSADDYRKIMKVVEKSILSTDIAMYFKKRDRFLDVSNDGEFEWQSPDKKDLLCSMLMTACDVSAIAKPWETQHKVAKLVADEFFEQGDIERERLNQQPMDMMDRDKKDELPKMQMKFINGICLPLYKALSESFPWVKPLYDGCESNMAHWAHLAEQVDMGLTWIDHETIEAPVERNNKGVVSIVFRQDGEAEKSPTSKTPTYYSPFDPSLEKSDKSRRSYSVIDAFKNAKRRSSMKDSSKDSPNRLLDPKSHHGARRNSSRGGGSQPEDHKTAGRRLCCLM